MGVQDYTASTVIVAGPVLPAQLKATTESVVCDIGQSSE